jgi:hypothetical protein
MVTKVKALLVVGAFAAIATGTAQAQAPATAGCSNAKMKCAINYTKGILGVQAKAAKGGVAEDPLAIQKVTDKYSGLATSCIEKADGKFLAACPFAGDGGLKAEMDALMGGLKTQLYVNPTPTGANACFAAQTKCVANTIKGLIGADSKALKGGLFTDALAIDKVVCKYDDSASNAVGSPTKCLGLGKGCMQKLEAPGKACTLTGLAGQSASVLDQVTAFINQSTCEQSPAGATYNVTTAAPTGNCGTTSPGTLNPLLVCGSLYIGGGASTTPYGATPAGSASRFNLAGGKNRVCPRTAAETGSNLDCSDVGCFFGTPLPIVNGPLSTCVDNAFITKGYGALVPQSGVFKGDILLGSTVAVTANAAEPCPKCIAGACDSAAANAGASCVAGSTTNESHDCLPAGPSLPQFAVSLAGITTGTSSLTNGSGLFCPSQANAGAFGDPAVTNITETGSPAGNITTAAGAATLASVYCIPATGNVLIDGAADLPGPGAVSLQISADVLP